MVVLREVWVCCRDRCVESISCAIVKRESAAVISSRVRAKRCWNVASVRMLATRVERVCGIGRK